MRWVRWTLLVQLVFFLGWAGWQEWRKQDASEIVLTTVPVDPRDLWSGYYMTLRYEISRAPCFYQGTAQGTRVEVQLVPDRMVELKGRRYQVWKAAQCVFADAGTPGLEDSPTSRWIAGTWENGGVVYGIEKYFFSEARKKEMNELRSGRFYVKAAVGKDRRLIMKDLLVPENGNVAPAPAAVVVPTITPLPVPPMTPHSSLLTPHFTSVPPKPSPSRPVVREEPPPEQPASDGAVKVYRVPARKKK